MDAIDKKILMLLQQDAKQNTKEIAEKVGLSVSPLLKELKNWSKRNTLGIMWLYWMPPKLENR